MVKFSPSKLISERIAAGRRAQELIFRAVRLDRKRDSSALNDLFVKKFQCGPWFEPYLFQDGFSLAFQFGVDSAFCYCAHGPNVAQTWPMSIRCDEQSANELLSEVGCESFDTPKRRRGTSPEMVQSAKPAIR